MPHALLSAPPYMALAVHSALIIHHADESLSPGSPARAPRRAAAAQLQRPAPPDRLREGGESVWLLRAVLCETVIESFARLEANSHCVPQQPTGGSLLGALLWRSVRRGSRLLLHANDKEGACDSE